MCKKIVIVFVGVLMALSAQAQGFKGGLHLGLLATQVDGDNHAGYKKVGLFAGAFTNYSFPEKKIQLQFELNYAQKGSHNKTIYHIKLHQVEPTLLLNWNFWDKFWLEPGLAFNILASAKEYANRNLVPEVLGSNFYRFHLDGVVGLGFRFHEHWSSSLRYSYSLSPIGRANKLGNGRGISGNMFNNCLLFRLCYQF
ncbi:MAG: outer membrane beta-barrel protein [Lentimicrobiaceae bacterium]|nr:outer membrane beta-barrel protein [Lentimicrobiaceae bacterium]